MYDRLKNTTFMKSFFRIILFVIGFCLLLGLVLGNLPKSIMKLFSFRSTSMIDEIPDTANTIYSIPDQYLKLLHLSDTCCKNHADGELYFSNTLQSKYRNPVSFFIYDKKYFLQVYDIGKPYSSSLINALKISESEEKEMSGEVYSVDIISSVRYGFRLTQPPKINLIYLNMDDKDEHIILKNDSTVYLTAMFKRYSIKYTANGYDDIYGATKESLFSASYDPLEMIFLKRNNTLHLFVMSVYKDGVNYVPGTLYNLIKSEL